MVTTQKDLNDWLPVTASRKAKWYYSAFHNVTAVVGAGVLGFPYVMARLGWTAGLISIAMSWMMSWFTIWLLVNMHEAMPGRRFDRLSELGDYAFGKRTSYWAVTIQQLVVQVGSDIVYMVTGGKSLHKALTLMVPEADMRTTYYILIFGSIHLVLSQVPNFNSLKIISLAAAVMSVSYSVIATGTSIYEGTYGSVKPDYGLRSTKTIDIVMDVFSSLGIVAFAFAGHSVILEIQATIPSTPERPSSVSMWKGTVVANIIVGICYFPVAATGFWAFGNTVEEDILISLHRPKWLISLANFFVFVHVVGSYQVFAMPVFDKIESTLVKKFNFTPGHPLRICARSTYVVVTALIGICVPFFGALLGFFGGLCFATTSYIVPTSMWLAIKRPEKFSLIWILCVVCIIYGSIILALGPIGGLRDIIVNWKNYDMFT